MHQERKPKVACFGEILWDLFPGKDKQAGGAPFNVGYHLHQMGIDVHAISAVGKDALGDELLQRLSGWRMSDGGIQRSDTNATSTVVATIDEDNEAHYEIKEGVAWDYIKLLSADQELLKNADAFVFGSLATRNEVSRNTLFQLVENARYCVFDVNLRPPFVDKNVLLALLEKADLAKFNLAELNLVLSFLGKEYANELDGMSFLQDHFRLSEIILSRGASGATYFTKENNFTLPATKIKVNDTVGSGDSFLAGFLSGSLLGLNAEEALEQGICLSGFVTTQSGACPDYTKADIEVMKEKYRNQS